MKRRWILYVLIAPFSCLAVCLLLSDGRLLIFGLLRGEGLHEFKPTSYWVEQLKSNDPVAAGKACSALFYIRPKSKEAAEALFQIILADPDKGEKYRNATGDECSPRTAAMVLGPILGRLGADAEYLVPQLIALLNHGGSFSKQWAAELLGQMGPSAREAIPALLAVLHEKSHRAHNEATTALVKIDSDALTSAMVKDLLFCLSRIWKNASVGLA